MSQTDIVLLGAGKIGRMIFSLLHGCGDYCLHVVDGDQSNLNQIPNVSNVYKYKQEITETKKLHNVLQGKFAVLNACPFQVTPMIAEAAKVANLHYLDLTEDVETTKFIKSIAQGSSKAFISQCGLAPGFISIAAYDLAKDFDSLLKVHMRVGALPIYPSNALKYNLTWSTDGLINEYCNHCQAIHEGELREVLPLEGEEAFSLDGVSYEAFNTSGGLGTLCETLLGKVESLNYKTVRYPGHRDIVKMLVQDLRLGQRRTLFKNVLEQAIPATMQDVVLIFIAVNGYKDGLFLQETYAKKIYHNTIDGKEWSAIQITTAASICTVLDLLHKNKIPNKGFVKQEEIFLTDFINNRFGQYYC